MTFLHDDIAQNPLGYSLTPTPHFPTVTFVFFFLPFPHWQKLSFFLSPPIELPSFCDRLHSMPADRFFLSPLASPVFALPLDVKAQRSRARPTPSPAPSRAGSLPSPPHLPTGSVSLRVRPASLWLTRYPSPTARPRCLRRGDRSNGPQPLINSRSQAP